MVERLLPCRPSFTADSIFRAVGILDVNAYELHCTPGMAGYRALFPLGSLLSHACVANVAVSYEREPPFRATYVACTDIKAGEQVTKQKINFNLIFNVLTHFGKVCSKYVSPLMCTLRRRPLLREDWYFDCCCRRCSDPTELGSYLGAVLCQSCRTDKKRYCFVRKMHLCLSFLLNCSCQECLSDQWHFPHSLSTFQRHFPRREEGKEEEKAQNGQGNKRWRGRRRWQGLPVTQRSLGLWFSLEVR